MTIDFISVKRHSDLKLVNIFKDNLRFGDFAQQPGGDEGICIQVYYRISLFSSKYSLLCIWTREVRERVLCMPFAGLNHFFKH